MGRRCQQLVISGIQWKRMRGQPEFFDVEERLKELSAKGDELERLNAVVDFELFRSRLAARTQRQ